VLPLVIALVILLVVTFVGSRSLRSDAPWVTP
jgi:Tfp pilus assembly protein PilX